MPNRTQRTSPLTNPSGSAIGVGQGEGPGFYQGLVGRKTGRPSPRVPIRAPRHEQLLAEHGLIDQGAADPNQGQLFSVPPGPSLREQASAKGMPPPLASSRPGFMPGVYEAGGGEFRSSADAHKTMARAIQRVATHEAHPDYDATMEASGDPLRPSTTSTPSVGPAIRAPIAHAMHQRQIAYDRGDKIGTNWYATVSGEGKERSLGPGSSTELVAKVAADTGVSHLMANRVTALTSPRTAWDEGQPGTPDYRTPNVDAARNVIHAVKGAQAASETGDISVKRAGVVGEMSEGQTPGRMKRKAGEIFAGGRTDTPIPIAELSSQKVPNFEPSLLLGHHDPTAQKLAAHSYTSDTWDMVSQGSHQDIGKTQGGYAVTQMLGRRTALKNRDLAPVGQEKTWVGTRAPEGPQTYGENSMFERTRAGKVRPRPELLPDAGPPVSHQFDNRSETAKRLGIEF